MTGLRVIFVAALLPFVGFAADSLRQVVHVRNFAVVTPNLLRGAAPSAAGIIELGAAGVKVIIDLRGAGEGTAAEKRESEKLGLRYLNVPLPALAAPSPEQVRVVLDLLAKNQAQTVFIHCRRGKDRTGTVIACYRIQHDGWGNERALAEARELGMSSVERGMRSFIRNFAPASVMGDPVLGIH